MTKTIAWPLNKMAWKVWPICGVSDWNKSRRRIPMPKKKLFPIARFDQRQGAYNNNIAGIGGVITDSKGLDNSL